MLAARADSLRHVLWLRSRPTRRWRFPHRFPANIGVTSVAAILAARADSLRHVLWLRSRPAAKNV